MNNYVQDGGTVTMNAPYARLSGEAALVGTVIGVAVKDVANGAEGEWKREGVFTLAKNSAEAWTVGAKLYWDNTNKCFTTTSSGNTLAGAAMAVAANPSPSGQVLLDGAIR